MENQDQDKEPMDQEQLNPQEAMKEYFEAQQKESERNSEAIHEGFTIIAEKLADMMDVRDPEERFKLVEGYRALIGTFLPKPYPPIMSMSMPGRPVGLSPAMPSMGTGEYTKQPDPNCVTVEGKHKRIVILDWICILQRTFKLTFDIEEEDGFAAHLEFYNGSDLYLNRPQTKHLVRYLNDIDNNGGNPMGPYGNRSPKAFLALPQVQAFINEEDGPTI
jgi:hypothetical protein